MKQIVRNTLILLAITLLAGLVLACVRDITKEPIAAAQEKAKQEAYQTVFGDAESYRECETDISSFEPADGVTVDEVREAVGADGELLGWVMTLTTPKGYGGDVRIVIGVTQKGTLTGMTVIEMSETPGLGAKCTGSDFQSQFSDITARSISFVKRGKAADDQVDAISGATYTTSAIVQAVNVGLSLAHDCLMTGGAA